MESLHVAVVGAGSFGRHHVRHLAAHPRVARVVVVDRDAARAHAVARANGVEVAASARGVDAAVVAVPTEAHAHVALPLLRAGVAVLVEKPIAASDDEAERLIRAASEGGALLQVGHIERFSPVMQMLAARCAPARRIEARRHNRARPAPIAADVVLDLMIHDIDLALAFARAPLAAVDAAPADGGTGQEAALARLTFENGVIADLSASRIASEPERTFTVNDGAATWVGDLTALTVCEARAGRETRHTLAAHDNLGREVDTFVEAVARGGRPAVPGEAGAAALKVANRIRAAMRASQKLTA